MTLPEDINNNPELISKIFEDFMQELHLDDVHELEENKQHIADIQDDLQHGTGLGEWGEVEIEEEDLSAQFGTSSDTKSDPEELNGQKRMQN